MSSEPKTKWTLKRPPNINDIKHLECFICREEEDRPPGKKQQDDSDRKWVHACTCTLVAHEACLLTWIQQAQNQKGANNVDALRCPQCKARYIIESDNPLALRILDGFNRIVSRGGRFFALGFVLSLSLGCAGGIYVLSTAYGEHALQMFLGRDLYRHYLGDDTSTWPWHAWFNIPMIPVLLIGSQTSFTSGWYWFLISLWPFQEYTYTYTLPSTANLQILPTDGGEPLSAWPPHPIFYPFILPVIARGYKLLKEWLTLKLLGIRPDGRRTRRILWDLERFQGRVEIDWVDENGNRVEPEAEAPQGLNQQQQPAPPVLQPVQEGEGEGADGDGAAGQDANAELQAATIRVTPNSLGRLLGGALLLPAISNIMGAVLYKLSTRLRLLAVQRFLGIALDMRSARRMNSMNLSVAQRLRRGKREHWRDLDPVYWRNTIGLGLYILGRDAVSLFHLWLKRKELSSRRLRSRTFEGMDTNELDLIFPVVAS